MELLFHNLLFEDYCSSKKVDVFKCSTVHHKTISQFTESGNDDNQKVPFHRDNELIARLDPIILYLRIVHSIDFYNHGEYPNEDVMPNRYSLFLYQFH